MTARLRSIREAAEELGVSKDHVRRLISRASLRAVRLGKRLLVPQTELDRLIAGGAQPTPRQNLMPKSRSSRGKANTKTAAVVR
jgi:excisionase family DNA binding protein